MADHDPLPTQVLDSGTLLARSRPRADAQAKLRGEAGFLSDRLQPGH